jgi:hypothetical protein
MPTLSNNQFLSATRLNRLVLDQQGKFQRTFPLRFIDRLPSVNADVLEIIGTYTERVFAADIIAEDQAAAVYGGGQVTFVTNVLPKIKIGRAIPESVLTRLNRLTIGGGTAADVQAVEGWETYISQNLLRGVREAENLLACAMMIDTFTYNRLGVQFTASWGMPAALKVTPATLWTNAAAATPITDILTLRSTAANTYGVTFDRVTLATQDFLLMVSTTEFKNLIQGLINAPLGATTGAFSPYQQRNTEFAQRLLDMDIELDDKVFTRQNPDGSVAATTKVLPLGKVLLSSKSDDGNGAAWDWGNAVVGESLAAGLVGGIGDLAAGERYGPLSFYTARQDLNPPDCTAWAVAKGFPRRTNVYNTAVLTVR